MLKLRQFVSDNQINIKNIPASATGAEGEATRKIKLKLRMKNELNSGRIKEYTYVRTYIRKARKKYQFTVYAIQMKHKHILYYT